MIQNLATREQINQLNSDLTSFQNRFAIVSGKPNTTIPYPNGFSMDNCVINGWQVKISNSWQTGNCLNGESYTYRYTAVLTNDGVVLTTNHPTLQSADLKVTLMKIS